MAGIRNYQFDVGPETETLPTATDPTVDSDFVNKGYADSKYGQIAVNKTSSFTSPTSVTAGGGITPVVGKYTQIMFVKGNSGAVDVSANPQIVAGTVEGQVLTLYGCNDTDTLLLEHGTGLHLNGSMILKAHTSLTLVWIGTGASAWSELGRADR